MKRKKVEPQLCRFCHLRVASVQAHVVPKSFIREQSVEGKPNFLISNRTVLAPRTWTGVYDDALVCDVCEAGFGQYDDYGHKFFHKEQLRPVFDEGTLVVWQHDNADARRLKLFILCILWRASASRRPEFRSVSLDRWESEIARMIEAGDCGGPDRFPVLLERFDTAPKATPLFYPYRTEVGGTLCYKMELAGCAAIMALQGRAWPSILIDIALAPGRPVYLIPKNYETSRERARFLESVKRIVSARGRLPGR